MTKEQLIQLLKSEQMGAKFPDYDGGWDSALDHVIELLQTNEITPDEPEVKPACGFVGCTERQPHNHGGVGGIQDHE